MSPVEPAAMAAVSGAFTVAPDHPCLPGHFPGEAIVPAVLLLDLSCAVLQQARPDLGALREIKAAKFMRPVRPGEMVRVSFASTTAPATMRFSCETAAGLVAQGQMVFTGHP